MQFKQTTSKGLKFIQAIDDTDECIIWPYCITSSGYGSLYVDKKHYHAHRLSCLVHNGEPPTDKHQSCHTPLICHNRLCVNPNHLRWATCKENLADRLSDKTLLRGEKHIQSKLTTEQVIAIRADFRPYSEIQEHYNLPLSTLSSIKNQYSWAWLDTRLVKNYYGKVKVIIE